MLEFYKTVGGQRFVAKLETFMEAMPRVLDSLEARLESVSNNLDRIARSMETEKYGISEPFTSVKTGKHMDSKCEEIENAEAIAEEALGGADLEDLCDEETEETDNSVTPFPGNAVNVPRQITECKSANTEEKEKDD